MMVMMTPLMMSIRDEAVKNPNRKKNSGSLQVNSKSQNNCQNDEFGLDLFHRTGVLPTSSFARVRSMGAACSCDPCR